MSPGPDRASRRSRRPAITAVRRSASCPGRAITSVTAPPTPGRDTCGHRPSRVHEPRLGPSSDACETAGRHTALRVAARKARAADRGTAAAEPGVASAPRPPPRPLRTERNRGRTMKKDAASRPPPSRPRATGALARQPSASDESQRRGDATRGAPRRRSRRSARGALGAPLEVEPPAARRGALATCLRWPLPGDGSGTCHGVMGLKSKHSTCPLLTPCRGGAPGSTGSVVGAPRSPDSSRRAPRAPFVPEQPNPQPLQPLADYGRAVAPGHRRPRPEFDPTLFATTEPPGGAVWIVDARTLDAKDCVSPPPFRVLLEYSSTARVYS